MLDWTGLDFNMEHRLWALALILAPLKTSLAFFHGEMDRDGTWKYQEGNPHNCTSSVNHTTQTHLPVWVSWNSFPFDTARAPLPPVIEIIEDWLQKGELMT